MPERERVEEVLHDLALRRLAAGCPLALKLVDDHGYVVQEGSRPHDALRSVRERAEVGVRPLGRVAPHRTRRLQSRSFAGARAAPDVNDEGLHAEKRHERRGEARRQDAAEQGRCGTRRRDARDPLGERAGRLHEGARLQRLVGRRVETHFAFVVGHERAERAVRPAQMRHAPGPWPLAAEPALAVGEVAHHVLGIRARYVRPERRQRPDDARLVQQHVAVERPLAHPSCHRHAHERAHVSRVDVLQVARDPGRGRRHGVAQLPGGVRRPEPSPVVHVPALDRGRHVCGLPRRDAIVGYPLLLAPLCSRTCVLILRARGQFRPPAPRPVDVRASRDRALDGLRAVRRSAAPAVPLVAHEAAPAEDPVHARGVARAPERQVAAERHVGGGMVAALC